VSPSSSPLSFTLPTPRITSHNIRSLSAHATSATGAARFARVIKHIKQLLVASDILCLQETHLGLNERSVLNRYLPGHSIHYNNLKWGHAGTLVIVSPSYARLFRITPITLARPARGRLQALLFSSRSHPHTPRASFRLINTYLSSGYSPSAMEAKFRQLKTLRSLPSPIMSFMMGDFNFTEHAQDNPSLTSKLSLTGSARQEWDRLLSSWGLREVHQPIHTYYHLTLPRSASRSSRLDRLYTSYTDAELSLVSLSCCVSHIYNSPITLFHRPASPPGSNERLCLPFDHVPISLSSSPALHTASIHTRPLPRWLASVPSVINRTLALWHSTREGECPFKALDRWKVAVHAACRSFFVEKKAEVSQFRGELSALILALRLFRACSKLAPDHTHIEQLLAQHTSLTGLTVLRQDGGYDTSKLGEHIDQLALLGVIEDPDPLPDSFLPAHNNSASPLKDIKSRLPSSRKKLSQLRPSLNAPPTSDPTALHEIIHDFHTNIWGKDPDECKSQQLDEYICEYERVIPPPFLPKMPSPDDVLDLIHGTNDSSPGPDRIPFVFYRAFALIEPNIACMLHGMIVMLANGTPPPFGFNHALLHLIPKVDTLLVNDTRPISVTNADNRIIAKALAETLAPALHATLDHDQKGFIPGRVGTDHVHALLNAFNTRLRHNKKHYVLLLDLSRAFDSVSHAFIHACLEKIGMPLWVREMVRGLLSEVSVLPVLCRGGEGIVIERGVKQGCPVSPLLFVLCFDVLLFFLSKCASPTLPLPSAPNHPTPVRSPKKYAFADDLALSSKRFSALLLALPVIDRFSLHSGLKVNRKKTFIISTRPPTPPILARLHALGWGDLEWSGGEKYLGVMFGREVTTQMIFQGAYDKFLARAHSFRPVLRNSSLHTRTIIFNVFLLPLLYYLCQFYICPYYSIVVPIRKICHTFIVPYNGGGFAYAHLVNPSRFSLGPHTALRDLWSTNFTLLATGFDLEASQDRELPDLTTFSRVSDYGYLDASMRPDEHAAYAAFQYLHDHAPRLHGAIDLQDLPPTARPAKRRRFIYESLATSGYWMPRDLPSKPTSLHAKLCRWLPTSEVPAALVQLRGNARLAAPTATPAVWNLLLRLVFNALPFDVRRRQAQMDVTSRPSPSSRHSLPCFLCGVGGDTLRHVFFRCGVVQDARRLVAQRARVTLPSSRLATLLCFPPPSSPLLPLLMLSFNFAVWNERAFASTLSSPLPRARATGRIAELALLRLPVTGRRAGPSEERVAQLARNPPANAIVGFTDGSAVPNPGPCGAGYTLAVPGRPTARVSLPLGDGDNNIGEMAALCGLFDLLLQKLAVGALPAKAPVLVFSDSALCLGYLLEGWKSPQGVPQDLARRTRRLYFRLRRTFTVRCYWLKGHSGIPGNEAADKLAGRAAKTQIHRGPLPSSPLV
jgi:ribonuclease HI/exonuclease III